MPVNKISGNTLYIDKGMQKDKYGQDQDPKWEGILHGGVLWQRIIQNRMLWNL